VFRPDRVKKGKGKRGVKFVYYETLAKGKKKSNAPAGKRGRKTAKPGERGGERICLLRRKKFSSKAGVCFLVARRKEGGSDSARRKEEAYKGREGERLRGYKQKEGEGCSSQEISKGRLPLPRTKKREKELGPEKEGGKGSGGVRRKIAITFNKTKSSAV